MNDIEPMSNEYFFLAYNEEKSNIHFGKAEIGQALSTGQSILETFETFDELKARLIELKTYKEKS